MSEMDQISYKNDYDSDSDSEFGIVYLIQPAELVGTNVYKVGASGQPDVNRIVNGYKKGTIWLEAIW